MIVKSKASQINGGHLKNFRRESCRIYREKKREYVKGKINEIETNNRGKNIEICTEAQINLRKFTNLKLILQRMRLAIY
jgi:hypothetical protein